MKKYIALFCVSAVCLFFVVTSIKNPAEDIMNKVEFAVSKTGSIYEDVLIDAKLNDEKEKIVSSDGGYVKFINVKQGDRVLKDDVLCYIEKTADKKQTHTAMSESTGNIDLKDIIPEEIAEQINPEDFNTANPVDLLKIFGKYKDIFAGIDFDALKKAFENSKAAASLIPEETNDTEIPNRLISVLAPTDGVITNIYVSENGGIPASSPVFEICRDFDGTVSSYIPAYDVEKVKAGGKAEVFINNMKAEADIIAVSNISRVVNGSEVFDLKAEISDISKIDYYVENVKMNIKNKAKNSAVIVPSSSVVMDEEEDKNYIYVMDNDRLYKKYIEIDEDNDREVSVAAGLYANQKIIKNPLEFEKNLSKTLEK